MTFKQYLQKTKKRNLSFAFMRKNNILFIYHNGSWEEYDTSHKITRNKARKEVQKCRFIATNAGFLN